MKPNTPYIIILLIFLCSGVFAQSAKQLYKAGTSFNKSGKYADAIEQFSKAIALSPEFTDAYLSRADAYEKSNEPDMALEDLNRALVFQTKNPLLFYNAARLSHITGDNVQAADMLAKAIVLQKKLMEAYQLQVKVFLILEDYKAAQASAKKAVDLKDNDLNRFLTGTVFERQNMLVQAEEEYVRAVSRNKRFAEGFIALANIRATLNKTDQALTDAYTAISLDPNNPEAYLARSRVYVKKLDYPKAIDDMSRIIMLNPNDKRMYFIRGIYYQEFTQHQNAINDFNKVILLDNQNAEAYYRRAFSHEQTGNFREAKRDYETLTKISEYDGNARKLLDDANTRLYELNREAVPPEITLVEPQPFNRNMVKVPTNKTEITLKGLIKDDSDLKSLTISDKNIPFVRTDEGFEFIANIDVSHAEIFNIAAVDVYDNMQNNTFTIERTEINPPRVNLIAPYASDNGELYLDSNDPSIYVEGKIEDESPISSIFIDGLSASFKVNEMNPVFTATINITNKSNFMVIATDIYGNQAEQVFTINRDGVSLLENNPMGRTWVVFIENSNYELFPSLDGPAKDVTLMRSALAKYDIHKIIHKNDLTKKDMERFFSIELRDLVRSNRVNTLMVWYAGHGKFINEAGYWIPIDARRDDEFTYFNIAALRASMQSYANFVTHLLVITDACESGPTFYQAMREIPKERSCTDWEATRLKSSLVLSSAGYELALDNSQFTRTFANTLANNPNACIPIETIVNKVTQAVSQNHQQKPRFGRISGLQDEGGTFFFITKQ